jgi:gliding motility-associated protein GldE
MNDPASISLFLQSNVSSNTFNYIEIVIAGIVCLLLLIISAFVSGSEIAFFSFSPQQKDELKNSKLKSDIHIVELISLPNDLLATIVIINNFVNIGIIVVSSFLLEKIPGIESFKLLHPTIYFLIEVVGITFVILLLGEVIPKIYASKNAIFLSKVMASPLKFIQNTAPFSWLKNSLVSGTGIMSKVAKKKSINISTDELEQALALTKEESTLDEEHKILEGIVNFGNKDVKQIMRPRLDIVAINHNASYEDLLNTILENGFSRMPVYKETSDNVIGILYIKDLLAHLNEKKNYQWQSLIRPPFFVPENKKIDDLLKKFQEMRMHMAVVVDEYGGTLGIVTLEDVLEEIVGDITDEFDDDDVVYSKLDDLNYVFEGKTALVDFYKVLNIDGKNFEEAKGDADTLAGFLIEQAGKILRKNEKIGFNDFQFVVEAADKKRVKMIKVILPKTDHNAEK